MVEPLGEQLESLILALLPVLLQLPLRRHVFLLCLGVLWQLGREVGGVPASLGCESLFLLRLQFLTQDAVFGGELREDPHMLILVGVLPLASLFVCLPEEENHLFQDGIPFGVAGIVHGDTVLVGVVFAQNAGAAVPGVLVLLQHGGHNRQEPVLDAEQIFVAVAPADPLPAVLQVAEEPLADANGAAVLPGIVVEHPVEDHGTAAGVVFLFAHGKHLLGKHGIVYQKPSPLTTIGVAANIGEEAKAESATAARSLSWSPPFLCINPKRRALAEKRLLMVAKDLLEMPKSSLREQREIRSGSPAPPDTWRTHTQSSTALFVSPRRFRI